MILQVATRIDGKIAIWHLDGGEISGDDPIAEARQMVALDISGQRKTFSGPILVGIQGGKK